MKYQIPKEHTHMLIEDIYAFIDSKLQFINYQIETAVKTFEVKDSITPSPFQSFPHLSSGRFEKVLKTIEQYSKVKAKLLLMRSMLAKHNAYLSFELLTDNKYLEYSEKNLRKMLDVVPVQQAEGQ